MEEEGNTQLKNVETVKLLGLVESTTHTFKVTIMPKR